MQNNLIDFLKRLAIFLVSFSAANIFLGIIASYFIIYSTIHTALLTSGAFVFALSISLLVLLFVKVVLILNKKNYLGKPHYFKILAICLLLGLIAGACAAACRLSIAYVFSDYYSALTQQMQSSLIDIYTKSGWDVVALKQRFYEERFNTWSKTFFTDLKMTFSFSIAAALITPLIIRKKLKAINSPD